MIDRQIDTKQTIAAKVLHSTFLFWLNIHENKRCRPLRYFLLKCLEVVTSISKNEHSQSHGRVFTRSQQVKQ
jgi:hypothetical protein